jgi:hypothetical protein
MAAEHFTRITTENRDQLDRKAAKLAALLPHVTGEGFKEFECLAPEYQHNLLWLASDLAGGIHQLLKIK